MIILLHSSKSMRATAVPTTLRAPQLLPQAAQLDSYLKTLTSTQLAKAMHISPPLAQKTHQLIADWTIAPAKQSLALDCFIGDIYSGLRANDLSPADRDYADQTLSILSGLYGVIRPYDAICPYRLEMGYKLPDPDFGSLYAFWGQAIADCLPKEGLIINASSVEYSRTVTPFAPPSRLITPEFLTLDSQSGQPVFQAVHAKIARGAFARWLITTRTKTREALPNFAELGYAYDVSRSAPDKPVFVCKTFGGKGLSIRLLPA